LHCDDVGLVSPVVHEMTGRVTVMSVAAALLLAACAGSEQTAEVSEDAAPAGADAPAVAVRDPLPAMEVVDFDGEQISLADYTGTPLVVNFWASWCPPCIAEMPDLEAVSQLADGRVAFVGVNTQDTQDRAEELAERTGVTYDLVRDPDAELFQAFGVFAMPTTFYVDATGDIVGRHSGLLTRDALVDDLARHLDVDVTADR
jgi:cytochrome c biogenesis protein CcmG, thiol:disulfide interchange protein DsbE